MFVRDGIHACQFGLPRRLPSLWEDFVMDKVLPWELAETEETWRELVAPYLEACLQIVINSFMKAETDAERAICQGQIIALTSVKNAPLEAEEIRLHRIRMDSERLKALEETNGRGRTGRTLRR